jgi:hypothetical protein
MMLTLQASIGFTPSDAEKIVTNALSRADSANLLKTRSNKPNWKNVTSSFRIPRLP